MRIATATATDLRQCQAGEIRPPGEIEQLNLLPIAQARDQTVKTSDARARSWIRQLLAQPRSAGLQAPGRQQRGEQGRAVEARVHVERDRLATCARRIDQFERASAVLDAAAGHKVGDLQPHLGAFAGVEGLLDRCQGTFVAVACVRRKERARAGHLAAEAGYCLRSHLFPAGIRARSKKPIAPSANPRTEPRHLLNPSRSAARSDRPSAPRRSWPFGTSVMTLTAGAAASSFARYSPTLRQLSGTLGQSHRSRRPRA